MGGIETKSGLAFSCVDKLKLFLLADGIIVAVGLAFFLYLFLKRGKESGFRDDLWAEKKKRAVEDQVDKKILLEHRPDPTDPDPPSATPQEFRFPNFHGKAHEILGLPADAGRELVLKAYKHWIKRYHPDRVAHLGAKYVEQARRRAEQLNSARDELLKKS